MYLLDPSRILLIIFLALAFLSACDSNNNSSVIDYSLAEQLIFNTDSVESTTTNTGLIIYELEKGVGSITVVQRDIIQLFYTIRFKKTDNIIRSSYANNSTIPATFTNLASSSQFGDGFIEGVVGMKEKGKRVVIIPPKESIFTDTVIVDLNLDSIIF